MNRISFLNRGYAFKGLLAVNVGNDHEMPQSEMNFPLQKTEVEKLN